MQDIWLDYSLCAACSCLVYTAVHVPFACSAALSARLLLHNNDWPPSPLQDKPLPAQQLNRPMAPKRPRDPDRFRNIDVTPGDSQQDPQYQRMVADVSTGSKKGPCLTLTTIEQLLLWHVAQQYVGAAHHDCLKLAVTVLINMTDMWVVFAD